MKTVYLKDDFFIKRAFKVLNEYDGVEQLYFILADGSVICINADFKENPAHITIPNIKHSIMRYGGKCFACGSLIVGRQNGEEWEFSCTECSKNFILSDKKIDEFVHNSLIKLDKDIELE